MNHSTKGIRIGRLLRATVSGFSFGVGISQVELPSLGALVYAPVSEGYGVYGVVQDIIVGDDRVTHQLAKNELINEQVLLDNRVNRSVPVEISVIAVGFCEENMIYQWVPPRPPLALDEIYLIGDEDCISFSGSQGQGYLKHLGNCVTPSAGDMMIAHIRWVQTVQSRAGDINWYKLALVEVAFIFRDEPNIYLQVVKATSRMIS